MAMVTWTPEPGDDSEATTAFGTAFKAGEATEVTDEKVLAKMAGNPFFSVAGADDDEETKRGRGRPRNS
jgi:hypothetical protein